MRLPRKLPVSGRAKSEEKRPSPDLARCRLSRRLSSDGLATPLQHNMCTAKANNSVGVIRDRQHQAGQPKKNVETAPSFGETSSETKSYDPEAVCLAITNPGKTTGRPTTTKIPCFSTSATYQKSAISLNQVV